MKVVKRRDLLVTCVLAVVTSTSIAASEPLRTIQAGETGRVIITASGATKELRLVTSPVPVKGADFRLKLEGRVQTIKDFRLMAVRQEPWGTSVQLQNADLEVTVEYRQTPLGSLQKVLSLRPFRDVLLETIEVECLELPSTVAVTIPKAAAFFDRTAGPPICVFLESGSSGGFLSLDFAYCDIVFSAGQLSIGYEPVIRLKQGEVYRSHAVTFRGYRLAGRRSGGGYDTAAAAAFRNYVRFEYAVPIYPGPQLYYTQMVNRYVEINYDLPPTPPDETPVWNTIFYTLSDANYYMLRPEKIPEEIDFCKSLSMDVCQLYEGPFEWIDGNPSAATLKKIGDYARERGIKLGLYAAANHLTAPHFNHYGQDKGKPEWKMLDEKGKRDGYCWGSGDFCNWFVDMIVEASKRGNFHNMNFDFLDIKPCMDPNHDHAIGRQGIYRQVYNLTHVLTAIRESVPGFSYDSNLGWPPFVPKIAPWMDGFYLTDPHFTTYFPVLNTNEHLDNSRRYQMASYYFNYLTPVEYFRNCEYFLIPDSVVHDRNMFEYGILQGLAVTPNLMLGEARALFDRLSAANQERARRFLNRWTQFVRDNHEYYANTLFLSGMPEVGQLEIYAHAKGNRSFVFFVNPNPFPLKGTIKFDSSIGLSGPGPYLIHELYPEDRILSGHDGLHAKGAESLECAVSSRTVRVLEIGPPPAFGNRPIEIAGAAASYDRFSDHYSIQVEANQGENRAIRVFLPSGESPLRAETGGKPVALESAPGGFSVRLQFPKQQVEEHVLDWVPITASLEQGMSDQVWAKIPEAPAVSFPQLKSAVPAGNFLGARIENLLNERYKREFLLYFTPGESRLPSVAGPAPSAKSPGAPLNLPGNECWYVTRFPVSWVQRYIPPPPEEQNYISLNFRDPAKVRAVRAWLNGKEAQVLQFHYHRGPEWASNYYINGTRDGLKPGENTMAVFVAYGEPSKDKPREATK